MAAVFPGTLYIPTTSRPRASTILVHISTIRGTNSEKEDCNERIIKYNKILFDYKQIFLPMDKVQVAL